MRLARPLAAAPVPEGIVARAGVAAAAWTRAAARARFGCSSGRQLRPIPTSSAPTARLAPIVARDRDIVAEDIRRGRPDGILVNTVNPRFHRWAMTDPTLAAALADYALATSSHAADWPIDLYVRKDEIGLRRSLPEPGERPTP